LGKYLKEGHREFGVAGNVFFTKNLVVTAHRSAPGILFDHRSAAKNVALFRSNERGTSCMVSRYVQLCIATLGACCHSSPLMLPRPCRDSE